MNGDSQMQMETGPGQVFASGREALGITREQAADVLNLPVRVIGAIEENDAGKLPDTVYVNGYIRSYAKLLGLAAQPLIDAWSAQHAQQDEEDAPLEGFATNSATKAVNVVPFKMGRWLVIAVLLSAGFVYFVASNNNGAEERQVVAVSSIQQSASQAGVPLSSVSEVSMSEYSPVAVTATAAETFEVSGEEARESEVAEVTQVRPLEKGATEKVAIEDVAAEEVEAIEVEATEVAAQGVAANEIAATNEAGAPEAASAVDAVGEDDSLQTSDAKQNVTTGDILTDPTVAEDEAPEREAAQAYALPRLTEFGDNIIDLAFSADCWFEIRNEAGLLLHADLGRDGQTRRYFGDGPFQIKLGYSPGAKLAYNEEAVDLALFTRRDVASVLIGESQNEEQNETDLSSTQGALQW